MSSVGQRQPLELRVLLSHRSYWPLVEKSLSLTVEWVALIWRPWLVKLASSSLNKGSIPWELGHLPADQSSGPALLSWSLHPAPLQGPLTGHICPLGSSPSGREPHPTLGSAPTSTPQHIWACHITSSLSKGHRRVEGLHKYSEALELKSFSPVFCRMGVASPCIATCLHNTSCWQSFSSCDIQRWIRWTLKIIFLSQVNFISKTNVSHSRFYRWANLPCEAGTQHTLLSRRRQYHSCLQLVRRKRMLRGVLSP